MTMKIVVLDGFASNPGDLSWEEFAALGELTVYDRTLPEQVVERIGAAEIVFLNKTPVTAETLERCPGLRMIGILATGYNIVDIAAAKTHGVTVCNVPGYSTAAVAQMTFALLLEMTQQVGLHSAAVHEGQWERSPDFCFWNAPLTELQGKTMGIIGYGAIGQAVAQVARAFGMKVLATARNPRPDTVSPEEVLASSDVISLHCPQTAENLHMINRETISRMKDGAILLNTARGGLVCEQDVADALNCGKLGWYGADVVSKEPIAADNPLLKAKNCFITPHIAWAPSETRRRLHAVALENLRAFLNGTPQNVVK